MDSKKQVILTLLYENKPTLQSTAALSNEFNENPMHHIDWGWLNFPSSKKIKSYTGLGGFLGIELETEDHFVPIV